jgi:hypothetical protein
VLLGVLTERKGVLCPARVPQHHLEDVHYLRGVLLLRSYPFILDVPGYASFLIAWWLVDGVM